MTVSALALLVGALPALVGAADSDNDPPKFDRPEFDGTPKSSSKPIAGTIEEYEAKRKVKRNSKDAKERRKALRRAHRNLSAGDARDLAQRTFPALFGEIPALGQPRKDERIAKFVDDFTAIIEDEKGRRGLSVSTLPLRVKGQDGKKKRADLGLVQRGEVFEPEQAMTPVRIDKDPRGGFAFEGTGVSVKPVVADGADAGTEVEGRAFFGNVGQDTDMLVMATPYGLETFTMLRSEDSPEKQVFEISMPDGARLVLREIPDSAQNDPSGAKQYVEIRDRDDKGIVRIAPPSATDADGERIPVTYEVEGDRLTVRAPHRDGDYAYPIQVDPLYDVYEDFWSWRENGSAIDFNGYWPSQNSNQGCTWGWYQGAVDWNSWNYGLYLWSNQGNFCVDNSWAEWLWRAPRNSRIFRAEYGFMRHWNAYSCIQQGVWDVQNGGWDAPWENGGWPFENCNFAPNEPTSDFKTACGDQWCNNWQGSPGNVAVFKLRHMFDGTRSIKPKGYLGGAAFHLQDDDNPVFETINHTPPGGWVEDGYYQLSPRAHDDGVGMVGYEFYAPGHPTDGRDNGCGGARCPGVWQPANEDYFDYDVTLLPEGTNALTVRAFDILEKTTDHTFFVNVDRTPPLVSRSGAASIANTRLGDGRYHLHADASDGSGANDASKRSGMKRIEILVDGRSPGAGSSVNCSGYSCSIDWDLISERYATGQHTISVLATDQMNHLTRQDWEVKVIHSATSDVGPGTVNLKTGNFGLTEQDASIDASGQGLAIGRAYNSRDTAAGTTGPFGPGWLASLPVDGAGSGFVSLTDLTATADNTAEVTTADGSNIAFTRNGAGDFVPPQGLEELKLKRSDVNGSRVSQWRLSETSGTQARDSWGSSSGTYGGNFTLGQAGRVSGNDKAVALNGASGYVDMGNPSALQLSNGTVEAWVKAPNPGTFYRGIVTKQWAYGLFLVDGQVATHDWSQTGGTRFTGVNIADGNWHHVALTFQSGVPNGTVVYVDGTPRLTTQITVNHQNTGFQIGTGGAPGAQAMSGTVDEVSVYNSPLSAGEIAALYSEQASGGKVSQWRFSESSGNQARDAWGANDGTYTGGYTLNEPGRTGTGDRAVTLNGSTGYVSMGNGTAFQLSNGTIEAWVKAPNPGGAGYRGIITKQGAYGLFMRDGELVAYDWAASTARTTGVHIDDNKWHHVAMSFQSGVANGTKIYLDGSLLLTTQTTVLGQGTGVHVGAGGVNIQHISATIDDAAVYSQVLSPEEVSASASSSPASWELSDGEGNTTVFEQTAGTTTYVAKRTREAGSNTTTKFEYDSQGRLVKATAPPPAGTSCTSLVRGCRALTLVYATSTTATGTTPGTFGNYNGRVTRVDLTAWDPGTSAMTTTAVAQYAYDTTGRLREAWDPRISPALKKAYAYDAAGHMTTVTQPGQEPWTIAYAAIASDPDTGRVRTVSRNALPGTATTTVQYGVPLSGSGAPYAMGSSDVAAWAQTNVPAEATAIFPPDQVPSQNPPTSYSGATVHYLDSDGREVNVARPGGRISTTEYESHDKVRRELTPANRQRALDAGAASATRAAELDTQYTFNSDATEVTQELDPMHSVELGNGQIVNARKYMRTTYDEGAPSGGPFHLPTTIKIGARASGVDYDERTAKLAYDGQSNLGWTLRKPTSKTVDAVTGGLNLKTTTLYEATSGEIAESRMPANPNGGDARSTQTLYYAPGAHSDGACANRPEWAGLPCKKMPAAQPGTPGLPNLPVTTITYNRLNQPATETETVGSSTRTTTTAYDAAGRQTDETVTSSVGTSVPATTTTYNASNGLPATTSATDGVLRTVTRAYDTLGRITSYTDADGTTSTVTYDLLGRQVATYDGKGTQTRSYDATTGDLTSLQDSAAGTFTATYDKDGQIATQDLPNGLRKRYTYDETGQVKQLKYDKITNCSTGCTWLDFTGTKSIHDQWVTTGGSANWPGCCPANPQADRRYTYDAIGRLTQTRDTPAAAGSGGCTVRVYGFDADSNRTSKTTYPAGTGGACQTSSGGTAQSHSYDAADRQIDAGVIYDDFGRETALPATHAGGQALAMTYYADDQTRSVSQNGVTKTYSLDPMRRQRQIQTIGGDGQTKTLHYSDDTDNASWIAETADGMSWKRQIEGIDGELVAGQDSSAGVTLTLTNLHGDVIAHASLSSTATGPTATFRGDEFGNPQSGSSVRFAYLGGQQRRTELASGVIQMGVRTYVPAVGRFTAVDPVEGGSANDYDYAVADPVNKLDLDGRATPVCNVWSKGKLYSHYSKRERKHYIIFRPHIDCNKEGQHIEWKAVYQIRRRRNITPDKVVAWKRTTGEGSRRLVVSKGCKNGNTFNAIIDVIFWPNNPERQKRVRRVVKNVEC